ncbi:hypothetical protein BSL78_29985, partial [Apostichopus japonicus]
WRFTPLPVFLIFRIIEAVVLTAGFFYGFVISAQYNMGLGQFVYLTIWTYNIATVFHISAAVCTFTAYWQRIKRRVSRPDNGNGNSTENGSWFGKETNGYEPLNRIHIPSWLAKMTWFCFHVSLAWSPVVAIVYWSFLHGYLDLNSKGKIFYNIQIHAVPGATMIMELILSPVPVKMAHFFYPYLIGIIYVVFNLIYCLSGALDPITGENEIYIFLDWIDEPMMCLLSLLLISVALIFVYCVLVVINVAKLKFSQWIDSHRVELENKEEIEIGPSTTNDV